MDFHRFDIASLASTPWKNGGGTTREIVRRPAGGAVDDFDWRVSIATIAASGPFSSFPGVDRVIVLLDGAGLRLRSPDARIDHRLDTVHSPYEFPGDVALDGDLLGPPCTDFNLMTRRGRQRASVQVLGTDSGLPPSTGGVLLALRGTWRLQAATVPSAIVCQAGDGIWWDGTPHGWHAATRDTDAALISARIDPFMNEAA